MDILLFYDKYNFVICVYKNIMLNLRLRVTGARADPSRAHGDLPHASANFFRASEARATCALREGGGE